MVRMEGPIVTDWQLLFDRQWHANNRRTAWRPAEGFGLPRLPRVPAQGQGMGRVAYADARQHQDILHSLVRALNSGQRRIWLATPYFLPTFSVRRSCDERRRRASTCAYCSPARAPTTRRSVTPGTAITPSTARRRSDLRVSAVLPAPEDGAGGRVGQCGVLQLRSLEPALQPRGQCRSPRPAPDGGGGRQLRARLRPQPGSRPARWHARPFWRRLQQRLWGGSTGWWSICSIVATRPVVSTRTR